MGRVDRERGIELGGERIKRDGQGRMGKMDE